MTAVWERLWDELNTEFVDLARALAASSPGLRWSIGHMDNEAIAFSGSVSFSFAATSTDDVVVAVGVYRSDGGLTWDTDIIRDTGEILAELPDATLPAGGDVEAWVTAQLAESVAFFRQHRPLLAAEIKKDEVRHTAN